MLLTVYYQRIRYEFFQMSKRFPLAILCSLAFCIVSIVGQDFGKVPLKVLRIFTLNMSTDAVISSLDIIIFLQTFFCGICWFVALQLFWEGQRYRQWISYLIAIPVYFIISYHIQTQSLPFLPVNSIWTLGAGLFLLIFCAPVLKNGRTNLQFWSFSYRLWVRISYSFIAALVLFLGVTAILSCLDYLFSIKFYKDQYKDLATVAFTFFFPILTLAGIDKNFNEEPTEQSIKPISYLLEYLIVPLIFVYSLILYAYIIKIIFMQSLPRGGVVYLVSSYGCVGILTHLVSIPQRIAKEKLVSFFRHHFFKILIFPAILLGVGITYRLKQYGLTESRYMVVLCLIWFSCSILFSMLIRREFFAKIMYTTLPCLLLLASIGPWSISNLPTSEQIQTLEEILEFNQVMKEGKLISGKYTLTEEDKIRVSGILDYLYAHNKIHQLKPWFNKKTAKQLFERDNNVKALDIARAMGVQYQKGKRIGYTGSFHYEGLNLDCLAIKGYDYYIPNVTIYDQGKHFVKLPQAGQTLTFSLDNTAGVLHINKNSKEILKISLAEMIVAADLNEKGSIVKKDITIPFISEDASGVLRIQRLSGELNLETKKLKHFYSIQFSMLLGKPASHDQFKKGVPTS